MGEQDQLGVDQRRVRSDHLGVDLRELPIAAGLWALVAEEGALGPELHRLRELLHAVLEIGAADRGGRLGPQRQGAATLVLEGEHLLLDDVGGLADAAGEEIGVLEDRGLDQAIAGRLQGPPSRGGDPASDRELVRQDVERAPGGLELLAHSPSLIGFAIRSRPLAAAPHNRSGFALAHSGAAWWPLSGQLSEERIGRPLGAQRRDSHVPGVDGRLCRMGVDQGADRLEQRRPVAAGQVGAPD